MCFFIKGELINPLKIRLFFCTGCLCRDQKQKIGLPVLIKKVSPIFGVINVKGENVYIDFLLFGFDSRPLKRKPEAGLK
jgi:hypothetical protein